MKPKEYLFSQGLIEKVGKGRLSLAHKAILAKAAAEGTFIEGYSKVTAPVPARVTKAKNSVPKPISKGETAIEELAPILYPKDQYVAVFYIDGVRHECSTTLTCREHGYSICGHPCIGGTINGTGHDGPTLDHYEMKATK